jgi:ribulose-5-phosphate 4-epimerase/fuculose-1-phosphate aldolase
MSQALTENQARDEICRVGKSLFERGYVHASAGNISYRLDDQAGGGFLITPTDACLGFLDPGRLSRLNAQGEHIAGDKPSKTFALHSRIYATSVKLDSKARCIIHTHSTHCVALTLQQQAVASEQEALRELLPPITPYFVMKVGRVPVIPYDRPGSPQTALCVQQAIEHYANKNVAIRAVMLERLGPNVWHESPAHAMAALEELEETAKLYWLCGQSITALDTKQLDDLRNTFNSQW